MLSRVLGTGALLLLAAGCGGDPADGAGTVRIAVASNFARPLAELASRFEAATGYRTVVSTGSTGALYAQIVNGAPFEVFLAADAARPMRLESEGWVAPKGRVPYAVGRLVLFSPGLAAVEQGPAVLATDAYAHCAIANPRTAPYGLAARQALDRLVDIDLVHDRLVKGSNVAQTLQMIDSGAAELGFVARSQVRGREGHSWLVPSDLHDPILQEAVLLEGARDNPAARAFFRFLGSDEARQLIASQGYDLPGEEVRSARVDAPAGFDWGPVLLTLRLALVSTVLLLVVGTPLAWWLAQTRSRLRSVVAALTAMPLVMPPTVLGFYLLLALGPESPIGGFWYWVSGDSLVFSFSGLVVGSVVYSLPFVVQPLQNAFDAVGRRPLEVAATLGAGPFDRFFSVAVPMARQGFLTAATLGFAHTVGEFGVVLMIGGNIPGSTQVVSIAIYDHVESMDYRSAHVLAAGMVGFSFLTLLLVYLLNPRRGVMR